MDKENHAISNARGWLTSIRELVLKLNDDGLTDKQRDDAREEIEQSPLSVMVRDGWYRPGAASENVDGPEEYEILLTTGGPALRIVGELDGTCEPDEWAPRLQWQDWGVPWTDYPLDNEDRRAVYEFSRCFYFGE